MEKLLNDYKITFTKGDTYALAVKFKNISSDLSSAYFTVKENADDAPLIQKTLGAGVSQIDDRAYKNEKTYKIQLQSEDTANLEPLVQYLYDFRITVGNVVQTVLSGVFVVQHNISNVNTTATETLTVEVADTVESEVSITPATGGIEYEQDPVALAKIGDLSTLTTAKKESVVKAINDVNAPPFSIAENRTNIVNGEKQPTLWGKVQKWFASLKALAFKDKVETEDFATTAKCPLSTNADKVNNLEITRDNNGVLKIGDTIIPQKKLLWNGKLLLVSDEKTINIGSDLRGKILEFLLDTPSGLLKGCGKMNAVGYTNTSTICSFIDVSNNSQSVVGCEVQAKATETSLVLKLRTVDIVGDGSLGGSVSVEKVYEIIE